MTDNWIEKELLDTFSSIVTDYKSGAIDEATFKDNLFKLEERYKRYLGSEEVETRE